MGPIDNAGMEGSARMSEDNKSPTEQSTRPLGNTDMRPGVLERGGISSLARAKMRDINPDATKAVRDTLSRQQRGGDGHARD